jgi:NADH dehydrogenase [ubiquinone] 1 alpha subcomplex assembly factor 5
MHSQSPSSPAQLFDRALHGQHRLRASAQFPAVDFLFAEAAMRAADRLEDIARHFERAVLVGSHQSLGKAYVQATDRIGSLIEADEQRAMLSASGPRIVCDLEHLPFAHNSLDAFISIGNLHWVNDLVGSLIQARLSLKPDGLLLAVLPGARTLQELRDVLLSIGVEDGLAPRLSPLVDVRDAGNLLTRAGFALPVADSELLEITYPNLTQMLRELRGMGEANALTQRSRIPTTRRFWQRVDALYRERHTDAEGRLKMTVELVTLTAWKPHESQPKPLARGSGQVNLGDILKN